MFVYDIDDKTEKRTVIFRTSISLSTSHKMFYSLLKREKLHYTYSTLIQNI